MNSMRMPELDGAQVLNAVVRDEIPTRVLFLSTHTESAMVYDLLARGARATWTKTSSADEVWRTSIATASRGKTVLSESIEGDVLQQIRLRRARTAARARPRASARRAPQWRAGRSGA